MSERVTREQVARLIGKTVDITGNGGVSAGCVIVDVGERFVFCRWPSRDDIRAIDIDQVQRIAWDEPRRRFIGRSYENERAERA